jgi:multidrug efflux pump
MMLIGIMCFNNLTISEYPSVEVATFDVETYYPNASASAVESAITNPLEDVLAGLASLDVMKSSTSDTSSRIKLKFKAGTDINTANANIREALSRVELPKEVKPPKISRRASGDDAFLYISLKSDTLTSPELVHLAQTEIKNNLRSIEGVAKVEVWGSYYLMNITLNPKKLTALGISISEIEKTLNQNNEILPAGKFRDLISTSITSSLSNVQDFKNLVIKNIKSKPIFLKDIAHVELVADDSNFRAVIQGKKGLIIAIYKTSDGNPLEVSNLIAKALVDIRKNLPTNVQINIDRDEADFIRASLSNIKSSIIEAIILVGLVIFLFLNNARSCLIPILTIPISLIGSFAIMSLFGLSINVITLLAMVLAVGLVVDDAIVVLENIHRHMEKGESLLAASIKGSKEISFAIIAMTLTLASVYIPLVFIKDTVGQIFAEFAITLAGSVIISGITALTLSPMMCSKLLKPLSHKELTKWEQLIERLENSYSKLLNKVIHNLKYVMLATIAIFTITIFIYTILPKEIAPKEDRGIVGLFIQPAAGQNLDTIEDYTKKLEIIVRDNIKDCGNILSFIGHWGGQVILVLPEYSKREYSASEIVSILRRKVGDFPSIDIRVWSSDTGLPNMRSDDNSNSSDLSFRLKTTGSYRELYDKLRELQKALDKTGDFSSVSYDLSMDNIGYNLKIDPLKLASLGFNKGEISKLVQLYFSGINPMLFRKDGVEYDVLLKTASDPWTINEIYLTNQKGKKISLGSFAKLETITTSDTLNHYNQMRSAKITATPINEKNTNKNMQLVENTANEILPDNIKGEFSGSTLELTKSTNSMMILIALSLIFIYGIMAIQFESYIDPLIIMLSVPMSCFGALLMLKIFGQSINIFTQVGIITLIGLITKHGILLVDFANKLTSKNHSLIEASIMSARSRFRPILMTSMAMILGSLPLIISSGAGNEARKAIGYVLVGGLFFGTLLTLLVVPCFYIVIKRFSTHKL